MSRRVVAAAVAMALLMTACASDDRSGEPTTTAGSDAPTTVPTDSSAIYDGIGLESAEPSHLSLSLEDEAEVTVEIGPDGGEVSATSAAGVSFKLVVPAGALLSPTAITLTPVASATGTAIGNAPLAMVHLAPEGFTFLAPATLTVTGAGIDGPIGIGAGGGGEDAHLLTASDDGAGAVTVAVMHFSVLGISSQEQLEDLIRDYRPSGAEQLARSVVALNSEDHPTAFAALEVWARALRVNLDNAYATSDLEDRTAELLSLIQAVSERLPRAISERNPTGDRIIPLIQGLIDLWFGKVNADVERLARMCDKGPSAAFWIYRWVAIGGAMTELLTLDRLDVLAGWEQKARSCLVFEIRWDTTVTLVDSEASTSARGTATVIADEARSQFDPGRIWVPVVGGTDPWWMTDLDFEECTPIFREGSVQAFVVPWLTLENPGNVQTAEIEALEVALYPAVNPEVQCKEQVELGVEVRWGTWFYTGPISRVMAEEASESGWHFTIDVTAQTGTMGSTSLTRSHTESGTTGTVEQTVTVAYKGG